MPKNHAEELKQVADELSMFRYQTYEARLRQSVTLRMAARHLAIVDEDRDVWRNQRHALEAEIFSILHPALDFPDDITVVEMAREIVNRLIQSQNYASRWRARAEVAEGVVALMDNKA